MQMQRTQPHLSLGCTFICGRINFRRPTKAKPTKKNKKTKNKVNKLASKQKLQKSHEALLMPIRSSMFLALQTRIPLCACRYGNTCVRAMLLLLLHTFRSTSVGSSEPLPLQVIKLSLAKYEINHKCATHFCTRECVYIASLCMCCHIFRKDFLP